MTTPLSISDLTPGTRYIVDYDGDFPVAMTFLDVDPVMGVVALFMVDPDNSDDGKYDATIHAPFIGKHVFPLDSPAADAAVIAAGNPYDSGLGDKAMDTAAALYSAAIARKNAVCKWCLGTADAPRHDFDTPGNYASAKHTFDPRVTA